MTQEEFLSVCHFEGGNALDTMILEDEFASALDNQMHSALFDPVIRDVGWPGVQFYHLYGTACPWTIVYAGWVVNDTAKSKGMEVIDRVIEEANHFVGAFPLLFESNESER